MIGLMQPTMGPVEIDGKPVDGKSIGDILLSVGRQALGDEAGKGPLPWPTFEALVKEEWGRLARDMGAGAAPADFWEGALRRGGVFTRRDEPRGRAQGRGRARGGPPPSSRATAPTR